MTDTDDQDLTRMKGDEALAALLSLWEGQLDDEAEKFTEDTGEDFEQRLVEHIATCKPIISRDAVEIVLKRFEGDRQFYELAHMLIECLFKPGLSQLTAEQVYILHELCGHDAIWRFDSYFTDMLGSFGLPSERDSMVRFINGKV